MTTGFSARRAPATCAKTAIRFLTSPDDIHLPRQTYSLFLRPTFKKWFGPISASLQCMFSQLSLKYCIAFLALLSILSSKSLRFSKFRRNHLFFGAQTSCLGKNRKATEKQNRKNVWLRLWTSVTSFMGAPRLRRRPRRAGRAPRARRSSPRRWRRPHTWVERWDDGEGPNHSNFSDQSSVKILANFDFVNKIQEFLPENLKNSG